MFHQIEGPKYMRQTEKRTARYMVSVFINVQDDAL